MEYYLKQENRLKIDSEIIKNSFYHPQQKLIYDLVFDYIKSDSSFEDYKNKEHNLSLSEKRQHTLELYHKIQKRFFRNVEDFVDNRKKYLAILNAIGIYDKSLEQRLIANYMNVVGVLEEHNDYRQRQRIEELFNGEQIGCLGMVELGHSSNIKEIRTSGIQQEDKSYILNSNDQLGSKFFIANSDIATTCLLLAQYKEGSGPIQPRLFIIPLRDSQFNLLPGITLSDLGHKTSLNAIQHSLLSLQNYKASPDSLLPILSGEGGGLAQVLRCLDMSKLLHIQSSIQALQQVLTMSSNYLMQRRAFGIVGQKEENRVYEYPLVYGQVIIQMVRLFFLQMTMNSLNGMQLDRSDQEQDSLIKVIKSIASQWSQSGINSLRQMTGQMGVLLVNGITSQGSLDIHINHYGSNQVSTQTATKFLFACYKHLESNHQLPYNSLKFMKIQSDDEVVQNDISVSQGAKYSSQKILSLLQHSFNHLMHVCQVKLAEQTQIQPSIFSAWNASQEGYLQELSRLYGYIFIFQQGLSLLNQTNISHSIVTSKVIDKMLQLFGLHLIQNDPLFNMTEQFTTIEKQEMRNNYFELQKELKVYVVDILDAIGKGIGLERSPLHSQNVFQTFVERVHQTNINVNAKPHYWHKVIPKL